MIPSVSDRLLDDVLRTGRRIVSVIGTAKNVGKTVTVASLAAAAARRGIVSGIVSSGRDGERIDAIDARPKPPLHLAARTLVATAAPLVATTPAPEILDVLEESALGRLTILRLTSMATCEVVGPASAAALRRVVARLRAAGAELTIVDGAVDRIASLSGGDDAVVLATGLASGSTPRAVAAVAGDLVARLGIAAYDASDGEPLVLPGALTYELARRLIDANERRAVLIQDATHVTVRGGAFANIARNLRLRVRQRALLVACTVASSDGIAAAEPRALLDAVAEATEVPAYDLYAELARVHDAAA